MINSIIITVVEYNMYSAWYVERNWPWMAAAGCMVLSCQSAGRNVL